MLSTTMVGGGGIAGAAVGACCAGAMLEQNNSRVRAGSDVFMVGFLCVGPSAL